MTTIYCGSLPFSATEHSVRELFEKHGAVVSVVLPIDRDSGRPRGFGFVEMDYQDATKAIAELNGADLLGRDIRVNEARARPGR